MRAVSAFLARLLDAALTVLLVALVAVAAAETVAWTFFDASWPQAAEVASILAVWLALLAAAAVLRRGLHLRVELLTSRLPPRLAAAVARLAALFVAVFGVLLSTYGAVLSGRVTNTLPATGLGASVHYVPAAVAGALLAFFALEEAVHGPPADAEP